jgi:hypothetical protein
MTLTLGPPAIFEPTPSGARWIVEAKAGRIVGERIEAELTGDANADWFIIGPGQVGTVDARLLARTADGALILLQYNGRVDLADGPGSIYIAPRFDTSDERYRWLNAIQAVGRGTFTDQTTLVYELYEVR